MTIKSYLLSLSATPFAPRAPRFPRDYCYEDDGSKGGYGDGGYGDGGYGDGGYGDRDDEHSGGGGDDWWALKQGCLGCSNCGCSKDMINQ